LKQSLTAVFCSVVLYFAIGASASHADDKAAPPAPSQVATPQPDAEQQRQFAEKQQKLAERRRLLEEDQKILNEEMKQKGVVPDVGMVVPNEAAADGGKNTGVHMHDGFFLRLAPGVGFMSDNETLGANKFEYSGTSSLFDFAIGGAIIENLIVFLDVSAAVVSEPKLKVNGQSATTNSSDHSTSILGLGLAYYFPSNIYLSGAVGRAITSLKANGKTYETKNGYGLNMMLGKEWWVSDNWGLGIAGQWLYSDCPDIDFAGSTPHVKASSFGVLFSATYN
jgi:hypothetical protein